MKLLNDPPEEYVVPLLLVIAVVSLFLPWAISRLRERVGILQPVSRRLRKRRHSVLLSLVAAVVAFPCVLVLGVLMFFLAGLCAMILGAPPETKPWGPWGLTGTGFANLCGIGFILPVSSYITVLIYRRVRWEKGEDTGQTSVGHDAGSATRT
jgi:hypothetical protein